MARSLCREAMEARRLLEKKTDEMSELTEKYKVSDSLLFFLFDFIKWSYEYSLLIIMPLLKIIWHYSVNWKIR